MALQPHSRFLLLIRGLPYPLNRGGGAQRTELLRRALSQVGEVDLVCIDLPDGLLGTSDDPRSRRELRVVAAFDQSVSATAAPVQSRWLPSPIRRLRGGMLAQRLRYAPRPAIAGEVRDLVTHGGYQLVVARYLLTAAQCGVHLLDSVRTAVDIDDVDWLAQRSQMQERPWGGLRGRIASRLANRDLEQLGRSILGGIDHLWVANPLDQAAIRPLQSTVLPNIPFEEPLPRADLASPPPSSEVLLFVGQLGWPPNADGVTRFIEQVWPKVREVRPNARLRVVGGGLAEDLKVAWSRVPGVELAGFVDRLGDEYAAAAFAVVPVYYGGGTKIKVLEALAFMRTCVVAPHVDSGYAGSFTDGTEYLVGRSDQEFAEACVRLLNDGALRDSMAAAGRSVVDAAFSPTAFGMAVKKELGAGETTAEEDQSGLCAVSVRQMPASRPRIAPLL